LSEFLSPTPAEFDIFVNLAGPVQEVARHRQIRREGDRPQSVYLLVEGWALSSATLPDGGRQILKVHLPGDILGSPSMALEAAAETLTALTLVKLRTISHADFGSLFTRSPRLAALMFLSAQQERLILMDRLCSVGRTSAECRLAAFLVHLHDRLKVIQPDIGSRFEHPLTQEQIGDVIGLTSVHVNRVFRTLEGKKLIVRDGHSVELLDIDALRKMGGVPVRAPARDLSWLPGSPD
jgi:CRP/FNR family transcriptional regulator, anaerobic regulatory protein